MRIEIRIILFVGFHLVLEHVREEAGTLQHVIVDLADVGILRLLLDELHIYRIQLVETVEGENDLRARLANGRRQNVERGIGDRLRLFHPANINALSGFDFEHIVPQPPEQELCAGASVDDAVIGGHIICPAILFGDVFEQLPH